MFEKIKKYPWDYLLIFTIMFLYYAWLQWGDNMGDPDAFYHTKMTLMLSQGIVLKTLPWMQFSSLRDQFTDHHLLYHLILMPFSFIGNPLIGTKIATAFFTAISITVFYWLLKKMNIVYPLLFALLFISMDGSNLRMSLVKANSLSLIVIWFLIYALFRNSKYLLAILSFSFVWLYGGWPLAIIIFLVWLISEKLHAKINNKNYKILNDKNLILGIFLTLGIIAGLIINPYWPNNLNFYYQQFFQIGVVNQKNFFPVGGEWYGTTIMHIFSSAPHLFVLASLLAIMFWLNKKKVSQLSLFSFILTLFFILLSLKSRRYLEYYNPFLLLFVASGFRDLKDTINIKKRWLETPKKLKAYYLFLAIIAPALMVFNNYDKALKIKEANNAKINSYKESSIWLKNNTPEKSIIFHGGWDEWPQLFYYNDSNYYLSGLDPTFMENYNSNLHTLYRKIISGQIKNNLATTIKDNFKSEYVLVKKKGYENFIDNLNNNSGIKNVYEDKEVIIYEIN